MKIGVSSKKISTTVLISMTDVIFLLLLFLLITSNFTDQTGLPFKLPGSSSNQRQTNQVLSIVFINKQTINYNGKIVDLDGLTKGLKADFKSKDQLIKLSAPYDTPLQDVIDVVDLTKNIGYERIFIATERK